jgi:hypothetical protein
VELDESRFKMTKKDKEIMNMGDLGQAMRLNMAKK